MPYAHKAQDVLNLWYEFIRGEKKQRPNDFVGVSEIYHNSRNQWLERISIA